MSDSTDTLLEFPCDYVAKAFGKQGDDFAAHVHALVAPHVDNLPKDAVTERPSSKQSFLAVSVRFTATSKPQLDAIYQALSDDDRVLMAL